MLILVTAHEDKYIRIFDITTGFFFFLEQLTCTDEVYQANVPTPC